MRKSLPVFASLFLLAVVASASAASAQKLLIDVHVPFAFVVHDTSFPAGDYVVERLDETLDNSMVLKNRKGGEPIATFLTEDATSQKLPSQSELVFDQIDGTSYLSQVLVEGDNMIHQVVRPKTFAASLAKAKVPKTRVAARYTKKG